MNNDKLKHKILETTTDLVANFLYYDRKEYAGLDVGEIEKAIKKGVISKDEIIQAFTEELKQRINF